MSEEYQMEIRVKNNMNNPKPNEEVHNVGGNMYVVEVVDDKTVIAQNFWVRWLKVTCRITRHNGQIWAF